MKKKIIAEIEEKKNKKNMNVLQQYSVMVN